MDLPVKFKENYLPNLLCWSELADLINIRSLMTDKRVHLLGNNGKRYEWVNPVWTTDPNCFPPSLIRSLLDEMNQPISDYSHCCQPIQPREHQKQRRRQKIAKDSKTQAADNSIGSG